MSAGDVADVEGDSKWHLDKKVPIAIIVTLVLQLAGFGWMASKLDSRIESLEKADARHERLLDMQNIAGDDAKSRIIRIEEGMKHTLAALQRIEEHIELRNGKR